MSRVSNVLYPLVRAALDAADEAALAAAAERAPADRRDRFLTLLSLYDLCTGPVAELGPAVRLAASPAAAAVKGELETAWLGELDAVPVPPLDGDPVTAMRTLATRDRLPAAYRWLAREASADEVLAFLAIEGGPDGGFDDLVAAAQIGLTGRAKMEMARNYWDELGNGTPADVHTTLHEQMAEALAMPRLAREELPEAALERAALGGLLATNRWLQPELVGMLGLIELQAGPRCRLVGQALRRIGAPPAALPFYDVHAEVDPRHGKDWLEQVVAPLAQQFPVWGPRMVRGAWWRWRVNSALFSRLHHDLADWDLARWVASAA